MKHKFTLINFLKMDKNRLLNLDKRTSFENREELFLFDNIIHH